MTFRQTTGTILAAVAVTVLAWSADASAATISIPRIGLVAAVTGSVNAGPAWWPQVGRPGSGTTVAIAGHRTTHTRPFGRLAELRRGDRVTLTFHGRRFAYSVTGFRVFPASFQHIADLRTHEVLILSTCTPPGSASHRLVVYALPTMRRTK